MLDIVGDLLAQMATETDSVAILQELCGSLRSFVDADRVSLIVDADADQLGARWSVVADRDDDLSATVETDPRSLGHGSGRFAVPIVSPSGQPLATLQANWSTGPDRPTELDRQVTGRFANLAFVVIERHLARRRQLQSIAIDREMIAGEIHDDPIQTMTAVSLRLQRMGNNLDDEAERKQVGDIRSLADDAIERLRHVMFSLHPETLVEDGLLASIEAYCETYVSHEGLSVSVEGDESSELPSEIAMLSFRLTRNAIMNVVRHARAATMTIDVTIVADHLITRIVDDGLGFDVGSLTHTTVGHFGIPHARTLAHWAGGTHSITSEPGHGTTVTIDLPIH